MAEKHEALLLDGSLGEGGGQVLRTSLSLAALTQRPFHLTNIRANRPKPGLRPQHLTAVNAVAALCNAQLGGATLNSRRLEFYPQTRPRGGDYVFDVSDAAQGGSAGAVTLILQAIMWPLLFASQPSRVVLRGGTHVPFSPPFHYFTKVALPAFARLGVQVELSLQEWGWYPMGGGQITAVIHPLTRLQAANFTPTPITQVYGLAAVTNLPAHIPQRMARRAHNLLADAGLRPHIDPLRETGRGPGAGIMLWVEGGGASALGRKGLPADQVAETAVAQLLAFVDNKVAVDEHLADQLLLPMALAHGRSSFTTHVITQHTLTNAALLQQLLGVDTQIDGKPGQPGQLTVTGINWETGMKQAITLPATTT